MPFYINNYAALRFAQTKLFESWHYYSHCNTTQAIIKKPHSTDEALQ
jgi:hypothetical protein